MTQIEQKHANAAAKQDPDGGNLPVRKATPNIPDVVRRYASGESMQTLAAEFGVNRSTIYRWMLTETGDQHAEIVTDVLINRIAEADAELESAADRDATSRARERARFARMDFERRRPHLYGQRPTTAVQINGDGMSVAVVSYASHSATQQQADDEAHNRTIIATDDDGDSETLV
jgi:transcriptional regulator with XRE-family HTH domain